MSLQWRHISGIAPQNHRQPNCLFSRFFKFLRKNRNNGSVTQKMFPYHDAIMAWERMKYSRFYYDTDFFQS